MAVGLGHPAVAAYLARLEASAAGLPPGRREELVAEIRAHLQDALSVATDEASLRQALDRLGAPEEIVAAERDEGEPAPVTAGRERGTVWTPLEVIAVVALIAGAFVLPLVGPLIGIVLVWASRRWTTGQKVIATLLTFAGVLLLVVLAAASFFIVEGFSSGGTSPPVPVITGQS
jgi:hypothetical protein